MIQVLLKLTEDRKLKQNHLIQLKFFLRLGQTETWSSPRINSRASVFHNTYK